MFEDEDADDPQFDRYKEQLGQEYEEFREFKKYLELKNKFGVLITDMSDLGEEKEEEAFTPAVVTHSDLKSFECESNIADEDEEGAFRLQLEEEVEDDIDTYFDEYQVRKATAKQKYLRPLLQKKKRLEAARKEPAPEVKKPAALPRRSKI